MSSGIGLLRVKLQRARSKTPRQLARAVFLRVWPFSSIARSYYRLRHYGPVWFNVVNRAGRAEFKRHAIELDDAQQLAVEWLRSDGICVMRIEEFLKDVLVLPYVQQEAERLLARPEVVRQIQEQQSKVGGKHFVVRAFGAKPVLDLNNEFVKFALHQRILAVVNVYLGMACRLKYLDLWYNIPFTEGGREISSQRWHRDYDDRKLVKSFLYMVDVDEKMGPFTYLRDTHPDGKYGRFYPNDPPQGSYPPDGVVERGIPQTLLNVCTGPAGTLILCDTVGFHRGGRSASRPRVLFTATYATDGAIDGDSYRLSEVRDQYHSLGEAAKFAVRLPVR